MGVKERGGEMHTSPWGSTWMSLLTRWRMPMLRAARLYPHISRTQPKITCRMRVR